MKKLLSILAVVGLTATSASAVVSCSSSDKGVDNKTNAPSNKYSDFESWVADSKKGNTELVFVGGRTDSDSLSWLAAREYAVNKNVDVSDYKKLIDKSHVDQVDAGFSAYAQDYKRSKLQDEFKLAKEADTLAPNYSPEMQNYFWGESSEPKTVELHSILVDDISKFWTEGIGSTGIIDKFITDQATEINNFYHSDSWNNKPISIPAGSKNKPEDVKKAEVKATVAAITKTLTASKGPFFLVINNGRLAGITDGYKNYAKFNSDVKGKTSVDLTESVANNDIESLFKAIQTNVWMNLQTWIQTDWFPDTTADKFVVDNSTTVSQWNGLAGLNKTYDGSTSSSDSSDSSKGQSTYKLDVTKYID